MVADLRSRDVAAGGQGAPLVPAFHRALFARDGEAVAVLNLGGIANLTLLPADSGTVRGFDCGPANVLLDLWCQRHTGRPYDDGGRWAASGRCCRTLLRIAAPSRTSRRRRRAPGATCSTRLAGSRTWRARRASPADVQATLAELTAAPARRPAAPWRGRRL